MGSPCFSSGYNQVRVTSVLLGHSVWMSQEERSMPAFRQGSSKFVPRTELFTLGLGYWTHSFRAWTSATYWVRGLSLPPPHYHFGECGSKSSQILRGFLYFSQSLFQTQCFCFIGCYTFFFPTWSPFSCFIFCQA